MFFHFSYKSLQMLEMKSWLNSWDNSFWDCGVALEREKYQEQVEITLNFLICCCGGLHNTRVYNFFLFPCIYLNSIQKQSCIYWHVIENLLFWILTCKTMVLKFTTNSHYLFIYFIFNLFLSRFAFWRNQKTTKLK